MLKDRIKWLYTFFVSVLILISIVPASFGCSPGMSCAPPIAAEIVMFEPAAGIFYPSDEVTSSLQFRNTGSELWTFRIGYSVKSQTGEWYDVEAHPLSLGPNGLSLPQKHFQHSKIMLGAVFSEFRIFHE